MKLLDVKVVLDRDKGIQRAKNKPAVMKEHDDKTTRYAILSHRWGEEINYEEMIGFMKMDEEEREKIKQRHGYQKIINSCEQAMTDGYEWLWVDTCCIDKRSSAELSEAINSMYRWYQNAQVCYAYLNDVGESTFPRREDYKKFSESNGWPEWFVRGWTLQELIAPKEVKFFNKDWVHIGNKRQLERTLGRTTRIPRGVLRSGLTGKRLSVAQIMSWAAERRTTRVEDRAYSLMGLFGVNMPMLYGEGKKAFQRLQLEIIRISSDQSIFAWKPRIPRAGSVLAEDPSDFRDCHYIEKVEPTEFVDRLINEYIREQGPSDSSHNDIDGRVQHQRKLAALRHAVDCQQFHTFIVSNVGIQVLLPVVRFRNSPSHFRAILACGLSRLVTIDLVSFGPSFSRTPVGSLLPATHPEFKILHLIHHQDTNEACREFALDDTYVSYHGFTRCGTFPREFTGDALTLSSPADDLIVIVYTNNDARCYFAIGLGYYLGQEWVHVDHDEPSPTKWESWRDFGWLAYFRMWEGRSKHARDVAEHGDLRYGEYRMKHAHFPRSIRGVRVVWGRTEVDESKVMVDVIDCPGCCDGPRRTTITFNDWRGLDTPGLMNTVSRSYCLEVEEPPDSGRRQPQFDVCSRQRFALGDYGDYSPGNLVCTGNIFEDMPIVGFDRKDPAYCPTAFNVPCPGLGILMYPVEFGDDFALAYRHMDTSLALRQPKRISLPANEHVSLLLKALSTRLAGKYLVTTIIQCSDFYTVDRHGNRWGSSDEAGIQTLLCTIASPQVWRRECVCKQRMERFKSIREHFDALVDMSANKQKKDMAIEFFSNLFGLKHLKIYIGNTTIFERFSSMTEASSARYVRAAGGAEEDGLRARLLKLSCASSLMRYNPFRGRRRFAATESDPRLETVLPLLHRRCEAVDARYVTPHRYAHESRRIEEEIKSILQTLGADLFAHIRIVFYRAYSTEATLQESTVKYDRQFDALSGIQDIKALQAQLDATKDENEQRALAEDITGKILWLFWCGICVEADELLPKIVEYLLREGSARHGLWKILSAVPPLDPGDDQAYLQGIMYAGANTSKYRLWLDARATEQAKWACTDRSTSIIDDQGTIPNTSRRTPSPSGAHTQRAQCYLKP